MKFGFLFRASLFLWVIETWGSSFSLDPWILVYEPDKKIINQVVTFSYLSDKAGTESKANGPNTPDFQHAPVPVEISLSSREITEVGGVIYPNSQGADDFVVYPAQFILYPGDIKKVQIQWVGAATPTKEISLGFIATQLPLKFKEREDQPKTAVGIVDIERRYEGIIDIKPNGAMPNVIVDTAYAHQDSTGFHLVTILNNIGTGKQSFKNMELTIAPMDIAGKIKFNERVVVRSIPATNSTSQSLMPGYRRKVEILWPVGIPHSRVKVTASFPSNAN